MTIQLELPPELENQLNQVAAWRGEDPATVARSALADSLREQIQVAGQEPASNVLRGRNTPLAADDIDRILDELAAIGAGLPPCDDVETNSREILYLDHD